MKIGAYLSLLKDDIMIRTDVGGLVHKKNLYTVRILNYRKSTPLYSTNRVKINKQYGA